MKGPLLEKTLQLAREARQFTSAFACANKRDEDILMQLQRSATSVGANVRESQFAVSKKDFVNKLAIAQKEAAECRYWLDVLRIEKQDKFYSLLTEVGALLASIILTTKQRYKL